MTRTTRHRALSLLLGAVTGGGLWWLGAAPGLAVAAGMSLLVLGLVAGRLVRDHPDYTGGASSWRDNKWSAAGQMFVVAVAFQAVFAVQVSFADQAGLHVVVLATFMIGYFVGGLDALGHDPSEDGDGRADAVASADD
ncbi:hypothetical protein [Halosimplex amylolyticum]|uniref:hypothetical protein n=1 Tax=Halosimplex amylolyticum TaxID=3396616 RepID=UPI003F5800A5